MVGLIRTLDPLLIRMARERSLKHEDYRESLIFGQFSFEKSLDPVLIVANNIGTE